MSEEKIKLAKIHNFAKKFLQPSQFDNLKNYVNYQKIIRENKNNKDEVSKIISKIPFVSPISINLDLTTSCNYACDHCIDLDILNNGIKFDYENLQKSLDQLIKNGLKSVIIIGGGEPTVSPYFYGVVKQLKEHKMQIGVVTNGSRPMNLIKVAPLLDKKDWIRMSLDSGINETFVNMHKPKKKSVTLDWICEHISEIKKVNKDVQLGFSFIIVWDNCEANNFEIIENVDEMISATILAKKSGFDYISFKPFLERVDKNNAEVLGGIDNLNSESIQEIIQKNLSECKKHEDDNFKVIESTNLRVFLNDTSENYKNQPKECHMQYFRHILSPLGTYNCPVYRNVLTAKIGNMDAYSNIVELNKTKKQTWNLIHNFDASKECKEVLCLYNDANWFIEELINDPKQIETIPLSEEQYDFYY
tara:strand:- start:45 stop:1298 length:1254 start_codon:yes stop_codon:yes gene_type:complete